MSNLNLYLASVAIWGSTWLAIKFQLGVVAPDVSVAWRFGLASLILMVWSRIKRLPLRYDARTHAWLALQGLLLFGSNYVMTYMAEETLSSGLVAVIFSLMMFFNIANTRVFFGGLPNRRSALGAALGFAGITLLFWPELSQFSAAGAALQGLLLALIATYLASLGNMTAARNQRAGLPVIAQNAWAMLYGALMVLAYALLMGHRLAFEPSFAYAASLVYLALFGSVLAFGAYLTLLGRIGAARAGYTAVAIPVVALAMSTVFEHLVWQPVMVVGVALCLAGNLLVLGKRAG
jgi:drug/metabolite transporter (DMT)-like permease